MTQIDADWVKTVPTQAIFEAYATAGYDLFFVGGCVRNALLGVPVADLDLSTNALPQVAAAFLEQAGFRVVPTGIEHGTITVVSNGIAHEITTFRKDVETDGRRAVVAFSNDMRDDALRRDFTINALYADREGRVVDPLDGIADLKDGRVRFIEDPDQRIKEDYLRILRFFRFHARFAQQPPDADTLDAIARNLDGLRSLSAERITSELLLILALPDPAPVLGMMQHIGVLHAILPGSDMQTLAPFMHLAASLDAPIDAIARLATLGSPEIMTPLRLSKTQSNTLEALHRDAPTALTPAALGHRLGAELGLQAVILRAALLEAPLPQIASNDVLRGAKSDFPIQAADLQPQFTGPALGRRLKQLKSAWYASDLTADKATLLSHPLDNSSD